MEQDDLVQPVQELGPEMRAHGLHHLRARLRRLLARSRNSVPRFEVRMMTVFLKSTVRPCPSVSRPSSSTCSSTLNTSLMRLLDLVEQDHLIGPAAHGFGQHAAFLVADIARRRADQARDGVLLHELAHVDAHHRGVVVEQE